jgi:imidazolonepropionase-like amidohydrolase
MKTVYLVDRLIDGTGAAPLEHAAVMVESGRITGIARQAELGTPEGEVVRGQTLLPGLIDAHVHLAYSGAIESRAFRAEASELSYPRLALRAAKHARETLEWGVTAVRDLNAPGGTIIDLREAINAGDVIGPRVSACGLGLSITSGHMDKGGWGDHATLRDMTAPCDGPLEFRAGVREQVKRGADCIKINLCGGSFRDWRHPYKQEMTDDEIRAAINEAHRLERHVAAHTSGGPSVTTAVRAGLDSVEHGRWLDDECVEAMVEHGCFYVPTLRVQENHFEHPWEVQGVGANGRKWLELGREAMWESLTRARKAGVKIVTGTDAGFMLPHGLSNHLEIELLVRGGLGVLEAITAATSTAAALLGFYEVGSLKPGQIADMVIVNGNPLEDVRILQDQSKLRVFKDGLEVTAQRHRSQFNLSQPHSPQFTASPLPA